MPTPIHPTGGSGISFLPTLSPDIVKDLELLSTKTAGSSIGDAEADILIDLWNNGKKTGKHKYSIPNGFSARNISRLKTSGLIVVDGSNVEFTSKASNIIKTMVLAEQNSFFKKRQKKPYSMILAESKKPVRTSILTYTAQTSVGGLNGNSRYIWSDRLAYIDQNNNSFKEYTVRIYFVNGQYEVWTFHGRIGGHQTQIRKSVHRSEGSATAAANTLVETKELKGYREGARIGVVRSWDRRDRGSAYDLSTENSTLPGTYGTARQVTEQNRITETPASERSRNVSTPNRPSTPTVPSAAPAVPSNKPANYLEEKEMPSGYKIQGPVNFQEDKNIEEASSDPSMRIGWYVTYPDGKIVPKSGAETPTKAMNNAKPWIDIQVAESKLPKGFSIIGPPKFKTLKDVFIVRNKSGAPISSGATPEAAVKDAIGSPELYADEAGVIPQSPIDLKKAQEKKRAQELNSKLPEGYRMEEGSRGWAIVDETGNVVKMKVGGVDTFASGIDPETANKNFQKLLEIENRLIQEAFEKKMNERYQEGDF